MLFQTELRQAAMLGKVAVCWVTGISYDLIPSIKRHEPDADLIHSVTQQL